MPSWKYLFTSCWAPSIICLAACVLALFVPRVIDNGGQTTTIFPQIAQTSRSTQTANSGYQNPKEEIFAAAATGSSQDVSDLLKLGVKPNIRDPKLWTPLHHAAANGNEETVKLLLKHKKMGWYAGNDTTPLHLAARHGHTNAARQILKLSGHNWNRERAKDPKAIGKIKNAIGNKFEKQFEAFLERKTFTARELAVIYGHADTMLALPIKPGGDILHALSCAPLLGDVDMVDTIWDRLESRWYSEQLECTRCQVRWFPAPPLHLAVMSGNRATVALFLEGGLQAKDQSTNFVTGFFTGAYPPYSSPAHYAAVAGSIETLSTLERRGADLTALDHLSRTPLSYAVENLNEAAVELLVQRKPPKRSGWLFGFGVSNTYLGSGHVWLDKRQKAAAIPNPKIVEALKGVGFSVKGR
ncbi:Ankyrin-1 [Lobaria immixta]|nr:Ankyrin-1 [Lobaria immixta]